MSASIAYLPTMLSSSLSAASSSMAGLAARGYSVTTLATVTTAFSRTRVVVSHEVGRPLDG
jgi:hypothetical protein